MRLVHLSDLHLGFRAFPRTERGWNLRERDLARAFRWAIQEVVRLGPDFVLLTGDLFDRPDAPSTAQVTLHRGIGVLRASLPTTPILAIAGERDSPSNPADPGPLALLDGVPGVEAAAAAPRAVRFREAGVHALLVPHRAVLEGPLPPIRPDVGARVNLLLIRGIPGRLPGAVPVDPGQWSYVAVGGPHRAAGWASNVHAAGALERPGHNPWHEATEERGFLSFDVRSGRVEFHPVPARPVVDLAPLRVAAGDTESGTRRLRELLEGIPGGVEGKIVRVRLRGEAVVAGEAVSPGLLLAVRERAAHAEFQLLGERETGPPPVGSGPGAVRILRLRGSEDEDDMTFTLGPGLVLLTAVTEDLRLRLVREIRESVQGSEAGKEGETGLAIEWEAGAPGRGRLLAVGEEGLIPLVVGALGGPPPRSGPDAQSDNADDGSPQAQVFAEMERALTELRADSVEASGEVEVRTLDWIRNRQEAESKLQAYRDRARELRGRIELAETRGAQASCPTCGQALGEEAHRIVAELREEWEGVVQDGRWWKRRRSQLEEKPKDLQTMEEAALRLHARVEDASERLERVREQHRQEALRASGGRGDPTPNGRTERSPELEHLPGVRTLLRKAGNVLAVLSEGRLSGVRARGSEFLVVEAGGREWVPEGTDRSALHFALHLAIWLEGSGGMGAPNGADAVLISEVAGSGGEELAPGALELIGDLLPEGRLVLAVAPPTVLERIPERFALGLELAKSPGGHWTARRLPAGVPALTVLSTDR